MISKTGFEVNSYNVLPATTADDVYISDHCPIVLEVALEKEFKQPEMDETIANVLPEISLSGVVAR